MEVFGRESELVAVEGFVEGGGDAAALVLVAEPGMGKTTLWEVGVDVARAHGVRVLAARPSGAETSLSFAALVDVLQDVETKTLSGVPAPQLRALEVALLRAEPARAPPDSFAISAGFLNALRILAESQPLLVAIDDLQWLDPPSAEVLAFAVRRLRADRVRFLLTRRGGSPHPLEHAFGPERLEAIELQPLSLGAARRLLTERLELSPSRRLLLRIWDTARGNPLFVLELGRTLLARGGAVGEELPFPELAEDAFGSRVRGLARPVRRLLLAVALGGALVMSQVDQVADAATVEEALETGAFVFEDERLRASHPLLAAAARTHSSAQERRELHRALAAGVSDETLRARHLALATPTADPELAELVADAAARAAARGAARDAAELAEHSYRLTPADASERADRLLRLGEYLGTAGEERRLRELLEDRVETLPTGRDRARAHLLLGEAGDLFEHEDRLERALVEAADDPALRATALAARARLLASVRIERLEQAEKWAAEALPAARSAGPEVERRALLALAWARILRGRPTDDLEPRLAAASEGWSVYERSIGQTSGIRLVFRGEVDKAREVFHQLRSLAEERGEGRALRGLYLRSCELELRAGDVEAASELLSEWDEWVVVEEMQRTRMRCAAVLAAVRGDSGEAERLGADAIAVAEPQGERWAVLEAWRARGIAALFAHEPDRAVDALARVWDHTQREGVDEPGVFPVAPDLVEALLDVGDEERGGAVAHRLGRLAGEQEHPWGLASATRCLALLRLASGFDDAAVADLAAAADAYAGLGLRFDHARTLLSLGRAQRRFRKWAAARSSLTAAADAFGAAGSAGWAEQAREDESRVGARRPTAEGELTTTEERVARLAAEGLSNKEIAQALVVSIHTVEVHLSHVYAKLGIRSRVQLAGRLAPPTP